MALVAIIVATRQGAPAQLIQRLVYKIAVIPPLNIELRLSGHVGD